MLRPENDTNSTRSKHSAWNIQNANHSKWLEARNLKPAASLSIPIAIFHKPPKSLRNPILNPVRFDSELKSTMLRGGLCGYIFEAFNSVGILVFDFEFCWLKRSNGNRTVGVNATAGTPDIVTTVEVLPEPQKKGKWKWEKSRHDFEAPSAAGTSLLWSGKCRVTNWISLGEMSWNLWNLARNIIYLF